MGVNKEPLQDTINAVRDVNTIMTKLLYKYIYIYIYISIVLLLE